MCSTGATFIGNGGETVDHQGQAWLDGHKMETQTGPYKDHTEKMCNNIRQGRLTKWE
jgi:hypothetical protein